MDKMYNMEVSSNSDEGHPDPLFDPQMQNSTQNSVRDIILNTPEFRPRPMTLDEWIAFIDDHPKFKEFDDFLERLFPQGQTERIELYGRDVSRIYP